jgi:hypothetical protein
LQAEGSVHSRPVAWVLRWAKGARLWMTMHILVTALSCNGTFNGTLSTVVKCDKHATSHGNLFPILASK